MSESKKSESEESVGPEVKKAPEEIDGTSRRQFLAQAGVLAAGSALVGCVNIQVTKNETTVLPDGSTTSTASAAKKLMIKPPPTVAWKPMTARSYGSVIGANDRIRIGLIGSGGMGRGQLNEINRRRDREGSFSRVTNTVVTAVADVYQPNLDRAQRSIDGSNAYRDYRDLLTSGEVDGVIIASPEHWHHQMAIDSLQCGMDVYLQKPMTRTHEEALELKNAFSNSDRVFQLGSQYFQSPGWWKARELYETGILGKVVLAQTSYHRNSRGGEWNYDIEDGVTVGDNLDWENWLGPVPFEQYDPEYYFRWRKYEKFSGGIITDLLPHKIHSLVYVFGTDHLPKSASCIGGIYCHPDRTVADTVVGTIDYGDFAMVVSGATTNERGLEDMIRGHEATMYITSNSVRITPERPFVDEIDAMDVRGEPAEFGSNPTHMKEFFDSMRTRKPPTWNVEASYNVMTAIAMLEKAYLEQRTVHYDAENQKLV